MKRKVKIPKMFAALFFVMLMLTMTFCADQTVRAAEVSDKEALKESVEKTLETCAEMLLSNVTEPVCGSIGGEWAVFGLARWGGDVPEEWFEGYYDRVETYVKSCDGVLHAKKYTEYSRVILALTAIGKDPSDVGGYNLLEPLADYEQTIFQGINGPIFALLALDSGNYEIPQNRAESTQADRDRYLECILNQQLADGGWALTGDQVDIDITAMALQALAKYQERPEVAEAVDRALLVLSEKQNENGGYVAYDAESSETISQVITALSELGIEVTDSRFVKNGKNLVDRLLEFQTEDGGFKHIQEKETDLMATEQAFYALVGLKRMLNEEASLYTMMK